MGSGSIAQSQDEVTDAATATAEVSQTSMKRSMSRYKGARRVPRGQEPPIPSMPVDAVQRSSARQQVYDTNDAGATRPEEGGSNGVQSGIRPRRTQEEDTTMSNIHPPRRNSRRQRADPATANAPNPRTAKQDPYHLIAESHIRQEAAMKEAIERDMRKMEKTVSRDSINGRTEPRPSRSAQARGRATEAGERIEVNAIKSSSALQQAGPPSPCEPPQHPQRPQAFRKGSSRDELKRMISGPIPTLTQGPATDPSKSQPQPLQDGSLQPASPELSLAPRFDAPVSAANAGQRIVRVKYDGKDIFMPVTLSTTPVDVIRAAARQLSAPIDETSTVLLESFKQIGLERPLRRYEHIRDVLNSWDNDAQNTLVIIPSPSGGKDDDLDVQNVSKGQPGETTVYLYHSQKPGNWGKRWITLRSDGQVLIAKKRGGETSNICHLSDFDIYIPTPRYASKKIRPPKKVCFAVKSQQKSSMFMSTENFVHFFCTSDRSVGTAWYTAVQEWRSWYLVNVMGEGQKTVVGSHGQDGGAQPLANQPLNSKPYGRPSMDRKPAVQTAPGNSTTLPVRSRTVRSTAPASARKLTKDAVTHAPTTHRSGPSIYQAPEAPPPQDEPFDPASLLGRTYTQKKTALERSQAPTFEAPPPMPAATMRHESPQRTGATNGLQRHSSQRDKPKPLLDLTPVYQEPPQHSRKGRGVIPSQIPAGGLIEVATSPENAIEIPSATTWRKPNFESPSNSRPGTSDGTFTQGLLARAGTKKQTRDGGRKQDVAS